MARKTSFLAELLHRYAGRLSIVFFFNFLSVLLTFCVYLLVEPFCKLLFKGEMSDLSPISSFVVSRLQPVLHFENIASSVSLLILLAILLYFFKTLFSYLTQWFMATVRSDFLYRLRNQVYHKILILPIGYFTSTRRGDIVSRAVGDTQEVEFTMLNSLKSFITAPFTILLYLSFLIYINPRLTLYAFLVLPLPFLAIAKISSVLRRDNRTSKQRMGALLSQVEETIAGLRVIKGFNAQKKTEEQFRRFNDKYSDTQTRIYRRVDLASPMSEFLGVCVVMVVLVMGGSMVLSPNSTFSPELFITYVALFPQLIAPIGTFSTAFSNYRRGQAALDRLYELLDADEVILQPQHPISVSSFERNIDLRNLSFSYGNREVISDIDLTIEKGQMVALVGPSGSGKTTLADILERFYDPTSGVVRLDGIDIREYDISQYRSLYALVSQDIVLFNDTLFNNITLGMAATGEEVMEAVRVAHLQEFVDGLEDGLQHRLSDRGLNLSGGQRQRISIARAVLRNAPILILDEATLAMDTESERLVQQALDEAMRNRTVVVIAHRLSTIQRADQIVVLSGGRITERGTHDALMRKEGDYYKYVMIQNLG
ncbi:MAG: ABC transporter ATP-binding protein [Bacteroidales bacterium]|nr:ABC transporter ATP-binding protein [Bacteroidales bacterium]